MLVIVVGPLTLALLLLLASVVVGVVTGLWWDFPLILVALTIFLWGLFAPLAFWTATQPLDPCDDCGRPLEVEEIVCPYCGAEYYNDALEPAV